MLKKSCEPKSGAGSSEIRLSEVWVDLAIISTCCSVIAWDTMLELVTLFCQAWRDEAAETGAGASIEKAEQFITRCAMSFTTTYSFPRFCSLPKFHCPIRAYLVYLWVQDHISGYRSRIYVAFQEEEQDLHWDFKDNLLSFSWPWPVPVFFPLWLHEYLSCVARFWYQRMEGWHGV